MHLSLAFLFLLTTPFPSIHGSNNETKNSTKSTHHVIGVPSPKPSTIKPIPTVKPTQTRTTPPKISSSTQTLTSIAKPVMPLNTDKASEDKSSSNTPVTVIITKNCIHNNSDKQTVNITYGKETEVNLEPGSPLVMTHHINLVPGSCTGGCEVEIAALMGRVELLEKEMSTLKKKCKSKPYLGISAPKFWFLKELLAYRLAMHLSKVRKYVSKSESKKVWKSAFENRPFSYENCHVNRNFFLNQIESYMTCDRLTP